MERTEMQEAVLMPDNYQKRILTIPNLLSFFRLCLIPVVVWLYCFEKNYLWAALVVALSGLTDLADGFIARRFHMVSDLGKALDPIADKLTQLTVLFCLVTRFRHMLIPLVILAVKELLIGGTNLLAIRKTGTVTGADWHGKMTTALLYTMMLVHLFWPQISPPVSYALAGICTTAMLLSAVLYAARNLSILRR